MLALFMLLWPVSAFDPGFHFLTQPRIFHRSQEVCRLCYGHLDCLAISKAECDYKAEADAIFNEPEDEVVTNESIKSDVDTMLYDLMLKESLHVDYSECIPLISSYTDCHKGNICTGCTNCECSPEGTWNCSWLQQCRHEHVNINHRVLALVMENLGETSDAPNRYKRSTDMAEEKTDHIDPEKLAEWMYGGKLMYMPAWAEAVAKKRRELMEHNNNSKDTRREAENITEVLNTTTEEIMANVTFDEVLREIGLDFKINVSAYNTTSERNNASINTRKFLEMLAIEEGKETTKPDNTMTNNNTKVIIDLLNYDVNLTLDKGNMIIDSTEKFKNAYALELLTDDSLSFSNLVNVKKRSIGHSTSTVKTVDTTRKPSVTNTTAVSQKISNITNIQNQMQVKILNPINNIIEDKYKEIELLSNLRDSIINFISVCNATVYNESIYYNRSNLINKPNDDIESNNYFRRSFTNENLNKYTIKLKRDFIEVLRDIFALRKLQGSLSKDLKFILQAISKYMKNNKPKAKENKRRRYKTRHYNARRQLESDNFNVNLNYIKGALLNMLQVLDRDMPLANALGPLSPGAKKILKRVINKNYFDDSTVIGFRINDPKYDMVNDLKNMGVVKWHELLANVANGSSADQLYNMQLLYFTLSRDIIKLREAFALVKFSLIRRMKRIDGNIGIETVRNIDTNLNTLKYEIDLFVNRSKENKPIKKKMSLLKKIKNLLSVSKNNMLKILRNKKQSDAAENNRDALGEQKQLSLYTMQKWQDPLLKNPSKKKRSLREYEYAKGVKQRNRMKNIIPHYLRGKVNPALTKGKGLRRKIFSLFSNTVKPKNLNPASSKPKMITSTAKTKQPINRNNRNKTI